MTRKDRSWRFWLAMAALWWAIIAIGYFGISPSRRWAPDVVGVLSLACTFTFIVFALRPATAWAYRLGGTFAIGSLVFHVISVMLGLFKSNDPETLWVSLIWIGIALMLFRLFWSWWLGPVKKWHEEHAALARLGRDGRGHPG